MLLRECSKFWFLHNLKVIITNMLGSEMLTQRETAISLRHVVIFYVLQNNTDNYHNYVASQKYE
jgi:hypothetical protein